jgi:hypothetical protein
MKDDVVPLVPDISQDELVRKIASVKLLVTSRKEDAFPVGQVIDDIDFVTLVDRTLGQLGADETRSSRD